MISSLVSIAIMLAVAKMFGLPGIALLFCALAIVHIWYRRRHGYWMGDR